MSCNNCEIRKKYPDTITAIYMSASGDSIPNTHAGIRAEIDKLGASSSEPLVRELRAVTDVSLLKNAERLYLNKITFIGYDPLMLSPESPQDTNLVNNIYASRSTNKVFAQSQYNNGMLPINWLDNYCKPKLLVDGRNYLTGLATIDSNSNIANNAIGIELPQCFSIEKEIAGNGISSLTIQSALAQYNDTELKYQNYILKAILEFWVGTGYNE